MAFFAWPAHHLIGQEAAWKKVWFRSSPIQFECAGVHLVQRGFLQRQGVKMKIGLTLFAVLLVAGGLWVRFQPERAARVVHAQTGCDVTSVNGSYGYSLSGFYFDNAGNVNFFSAAGLLAADGQGNITAKESDSFDGQITQADPLTGTYKMNSDCTGSLTTISKVNGSANYDLVLTNSRNQIQLVETDAGNNVTGQAARQ